MENWEQWQSPDRRFWVTFGTCVDLRPWKRVSTATRQPFMVRDSYMTLNLIIRSISHRNGNKVTCAVRKAELVPLTVRLGRVRCLDRVGRKEPSAKEMSELRPRRREGAGPCDRGQLSGHREQRLQGSDVGMSVVLARLKNRKATWLRYVLQNSLAGAGWENIIISLGKVF